jgi:hypothetical protein
MIALNPGQLGNAISKSKRIHTRVKFVNGRQAQVVSPNSGRTYTVSFRRIAGSVYAVCNCPAGAHKTPCWHVASAAAFLAGIARMRRAA